MNGAVDARFRSRPNRFLVIATRGGEPIKAFLPNPGRLRELLRPNARLRLLPAANSRRSTSFDVLAVQAGERWVCLDTRLANEAVAWALRERRLLEFRRFRFIDREVKCRDVRFDFGLESPGKSWLEVKACSLVVRRRALFPDAPTQRGVKHMRRLMDRVQKGDGAAVLFIVMRDAERFAPNDATDPAFGDALRRAFSAGVGVRAYRAHLRGRRLILGSRIPTDL